MGSVIFPYLGATFIMQSQRWGCAADVSQTRQEITSPTGWAERDGGRKKKILLRSKLRLLKAEGEKKKPSTLCLNLWLDSYCISNNFLACLSPTSKSQSLGRLRKNKTDNDHYYYYMPTLLDVRLSSGWSDRPWTAPTHLRFLGGVLAAIPVPGGRDSALHLGAPLMMSEGFP